MAEPFRPDPDALLKAIKKSKHFSKSGRLTIFFGMAAGVGKTYAMLRGAQQRLRDGVDVVVGTVDTHGRVETEELLASLPIIPRQEIEYRGVKLTEMDLDALLARKPQLALVDELAHTNVPGSRHPKRYQDVIELLDAGIDVYTTLNVQHIESRKEAVESIAEISIRESVPDSILERASQIILIDITPEELLKRLSEGKVYLGEKAELAQEHFFKEDRLTALREIALRLTAEKVDSDLQVLLAGKEGEVPWQPVERLMVAVSHSPYSEGLIRATRRIAYSLSAPWLGVHVDTGLQLSDEDRTRLARNMALVRELGGEVITSADTDIAVALKRIAQQSGVTQLILGRPTRRPVRDLFHGGTLLEKLVRETGIFDIHVLRPEKSTKSTELGFRPSIEFKLKTYLVVAMVVLSAALVGALLNPYVGYKAVAFIMMLATLSVSFFVSIGPILMAAALSALTWNFFFVPPKFTFYMSDPEDLAMFLAYFVVAITTGTLTQRVKRREVMLRLREQRTQTLYRILEMLAASHDKKTIFRDVPARLKIILPGESIVIPTDVKGALDKFAEILPSWCSSEKEWAVAQWAFEHDKPAGWSTDTLPGASALYIPLKGTSETVGVLAYHSPSKSRLLQEEEEILATVAQQLAITLERELFLERSQMAERLKDSERLHQTILSSISHEIRTPLTAIVGSASALQDERIATDPKNRQRLAAEINQNAEKLNRVVSNLLDMSRLESGTLKLKTDWHDLHDVIKILLDSQREAFSGHSVSTNLPEKLPSVKIDLQLFKQALSNLLVNAATYTPKGGKIEISASVTGDTLEINVADTGPGLPDQALSQVFEKFYRVPGSPSSGVGVGLAFAKGIVEAHGGLISVRNRPGGGACFTIKLPMAKQT